MQGASRFLVFAGLLAASAGCRSEPAPTPCRVDASVVTQKPAWPGKEGWLRHSLPQPGNGWISSLAVSPDGKLGVYGASIGGAFIPMTDEVTLIRFEIGPEMDQDYKPSILNLPGPAMRNFAALSWSKPGLVWGTWSTLGTSVPQTHEVRRLHEIPIPSGKKKRETFPFHSTVAWAPGGDCVAATVELPGSAAELVTWKASGASGASSRHALQPLEKIAAWTDVGVILVATTGSAPVSVRAFDPLTGASRKMPAPPTRAQAYGWVGGGWLAIDDLGILTHHVEGAPITIVASLPGALEVATDEKRRWLRVLAAENGRAILVEESVVTPKTWAPGTVRKDLRHMHVLTPAAP